MDVLRLAAILLAVGALAALLLIRKSDLLDSSCEEADEGKQGKGLTKKRGEKERSLTRQHPDDRPRTRPRGKGA